MAQALRPLNQLEAENAQILQDATQDIAYLVITRTGLNKSIMDAIGPLRDLLKMKGIHNYDAQGQGPSHKELLPAQILTDGRTISSTASLYRPETKMGDPRIWFRGLKEVAEPNDLLAIFPMEGVLCVLDITRSTIGSDRRAGKANEALAFLAEVKRASTSVAEELLDKLRAIARGGAVLGQGSGDTAVGRTLEHALGIRMNSSRAPDYKGIELKSYRDAKLNRKTLFAQVADWKLSKFKSSAKLLQTFGYVRGGVRQLYVTVSAVKANTQGMQLDFDLTNDWLLEFSTNPEIGAFLVWQLPKLRRLLMEKHAETFWIAATSERIHGAEWFRFIRVEHTRAPILSQFEILVKKGDITIDHLISARHGERGPLFKLRSDGLKLLFPPSQRYTLA